MKVNNNTNHVNNQNGGDHRPTGSNVAGSYKGRQVSVRSSNGNIDKSDKSRQKNDTQRTSLHERTVSSNTTKESEIQTSSDLQQKAVTELKEKGYNHREAMKLANRGLAWAEATSHNNMDQIIEKFTDWIKKAPLKTKPQDKNAVSPPKNNPDISEPEKVNVDNVSARKKDVVQNNEEHSVQVKTPSAQSTNPSPNKDDVQNKETKRNLATVATTPPLSHNKQNLATKGIFADQSSSKESTSNNNQLGNQAAIDKDVTSSGKENSKISAEKPSTKYSDVSAPEKVNANNPIVSKKAISGNSVQVKTTLPKSINSSTNKNKAKNNEVASSLGTVTINSHSQNKTYPKGRKTVTKDIMFCQKEHSKMADNKAIKGSQLGHCIELLKKQVGSKAHKANTRSLVTQLYDSCEGQALFSSGGSFRSPAISENYKKLQDDIRETDEKVTFVYKHDDPDDKFEDIKKTANMISVNKEKTLEFIDLFTKAIKQEQKSKGRENSEQIKKKEERLQALNEVRNFVDSLDPNDPNGAAMCRLALQLCGRCRERAVVKQHKLPFCGAFGALEVAWGKNPLLMTQTILKLASDHEVTLGKTDLKLPKEIDLSKHQEAIADTLIMSSFYDIQNKRGSSVDQDMHLSSLLGNNVQVCKQGGDIDDLQFLKALEDATNKKASVRVAVKNKMSNFIRTNLTDQISRKAKNQAWDIEKDFQKNKPNLHDGGRKHAITMDKLQLSADKKTVMIKIQTWGKVAWLRMNTNTFIDNIETRQTGIQYRDSEAVQSKNISEVFASPDDLLTYNPDESKNNWLFFDPQKKSTSMLLDGDSFTSESGVFYQNKGGRLQFSTKS